MKTWEKRFARATAVVWLLVGLAGSARADLTFDLANDWSDTSNPNGVWSYNQAPGVPITVHQSNYFGGTVAQPAWANATLPEGTGHIPVWPKSVFDYTTVPSANLDLPLGRVAMHPNDTLSSLPGHGTDVAGVTWTSPATGVATISGDLWELSPSLGRDTDWSISLNGATLTGGTILHTDPFNSSSPDSFANGSGGPGALTFAVSQGDVVSLDIVRNPLSAGAAATFMGVDETISLQTTAVPEPSTLGLAAVGALLLLGASWHRRRAARARMAGRLPY
jgi:hypothetical protein